MPDALPAPIRKLLEEKRVRPPGPPEPRLRNERHDRATVAATLRAVIECPDTWMNGHMIEVPTIPAFKRLLRVWADQVEAER